MKVNDILNEMTQADEGWLRQNLEALYKKRKSMEGQDTTRIDALIAKHQKALDATRMATESRIDELGMNAKGERTTTLHDYINSTYKKVVPLLTGPGHDNKKKVAKMMKNTELAKKKIAKNSS